MKENINLETFAKGALAEKLKNGIMNVLANIQDPNTDEKKARKLSVTLTFKPLQNRNFTTVSIDTKTSLQQPIPAETSLIIGMTPDGEIMASEYKNQIEGQEEMSLPELEPTEENTNSDAVIDFRKVNNK